MVIRFQFHLMVNRCDVDQSNCEHFDTIVFEDVCAMYNESHLMKAHMAFFSPPLTCPLNVVSNFGAFKENFNDIPEIQTGKVHLQGRSHGHEDV